MTYSFWSIFKKHIQFYMFVCMYNVSNVGVDAMILCMYVFSMLSLESRCFKVMSSEWCLFDMTVLLQHCFS